MGRDVKECPRFSVNPIKKGVSILSLSCPRDWDGNRAGFSVMSRI
jgi:hypothetical protein